MSPVVGRGVDGIDAGRLHAVDRLEHTLDLGPAGSAQKDVAAGTDEWHGRERFARRNRADDIDA